MNYASCDSNHYLDCATMHALWHSNSSYSRSSCTGLLTSSDFSTKPTSALAGRSVFCSIFFLRALSSSYYSSSSSSAFPGRNCASTSNMKKAAIRTLTATIRMPILSVLSCGTSGFNESVELLFSRGRASHGAQQVNDDDDDDGLVKAL